MSASATSFDVVVVGSANLDIVVPVPHHPVAGETVLGGDHTRVPGGKGANQAVAAARLGQRVAFVGCVGPDDAGATLRGSLQAAGVDVARLVIVERPSGIALIGVAADGDNAIIVSPGANAALTASAIGEAVDLLAAAPIVLVQLEIPLEAVAATVAAATGTIILNPAPAQPLDRQLLTEVDVITPNRLELALLAGDREASGVEELVAQARSLGTDTVVVTLGADGALIVTADSHELVAAPTVTPVDTTGAGDAFNAALADGLGRGSLTEAVRWAVRVGAATTLRAGAQPSLPTPAEVEGLVG